MKPVAFFDIDGTLFRSSLLIEIVNGLIRERVFPADARTEFDNELRLWREREGKYTEYIQAVIEVFLRHIKGVHYGQLADVGRQVVDEQSNYVYRYTRDLIKELKSEGYFLVAISQSPKTILDEFCKRHGFDKVYGRIYEIGPQDCFTGEITDEHLIQNKANIVRRVFDHNSELSTKNSIGVGDTEGDIALLEMVDKPICFNPNRLLYDYATAQNWPVVVERKDVIYNL
ncbi:HAD-IB family hydrolase [Candidatus Kaiserbacteria bacterium]|nr:HAD-IB family hydrolase [Candidatus Kaiserbacteria bacterium]